jgi:hypothetical protein
LIVTTGNPTDVSTGAATKATPTSYPRYDVQPYQPDGGFTASGLVTMLGAMLVAGALIGFAAHWVSQLFYLIVLFPILIGLALGFVGKRLVKFANLRNPLLGGLAGFVGGVAAMTMMHYFDYQTFRGMVAAQAPDIVEVARLSKQQRENEYPQFEDPAAARELVEAYDGFPGYMNFSARQGVEIKSSRGSSGKDKPLNLGFVGSYIYWVVETLIVAGITFAMVRGQTREPFCTDCSLWKSFRRLGAFGGEPDAAVVGVTGGDVNALAAAKPGALSSPLELHVAECANCRRAHASVKLELLTTNKEGKLERKILAHTMWPADSVAALDSLFAPPAAPPTA